MQAQHGVKKVNKYKKIKHSNSSPRGDHPFFTRRFMQPCERERRAKKNSIQDQSNLSRSATDFILTMFFLLLLFLRALFASSTLVIFEFILTVLPQIVLVDIFGR